MKAELTKKGMLIVMAETEIEAYALEHWNRHFMKGDEDTAHVSKLQINTNLTKPKEE